MLTRVDAYVGECLWISRLEHLSALPGCLGRSPSVPGSPQRGKLHGFEPVHEHPQPVPQLLNLRYSFVDDAFPPTGSDTSQPQSLPYKPKDH